MREIETKLDVHGAFVVPDLVDDASGIHADVVQPRVSLRAAYYDAADLRLARAGVTLRHRTGEGAPRWTLKLPRPTVGTGLDRDELSVEGTAARVPASLAELVTARLRGEALKPVALLRTLRTTHLLLDEGGIALAEVVDDTVSLLEGRTVVTRFREVEVELRDGVDGAERAASSAVDTLVAAGAVVSRQVPKLVRALGPGATGPDDLPPLLPVGKKDPALALVRRALADGVRRLVETDPGVRRDSPDAVHQMRVACRRLRSDLRTFRPLLADPRMERLRIELAWLADCLGASRDLEVLRERLAQTAVSDRLSPLDAVAVATVDELLAAQQGDARPDVLAALASPRYVALLDLLVAVAREPVGSDRAGERCADALPDLVGTTWGHLAKRAKKLHLDDPDDDWHRVRILAKRARYAAEVAAVVLGGPAKRTAKAATAVQTLIGEHQDAAVAAERVLELPAERPTDLELAVTCGRLAERERAAVTAARLAFLELWPEASGAKTTAWMR